MSLPLTRQKLSAYQLGKKEVHIWSMNTKAHFCHLNNYLNLLSKEEVQRAESYLHLEHSNHFIARRAALRIILSFYIFIDPMNISIKADQNGKLWLNHDRSDIFFNLSHCNDIAYFVISSTPYVGIDIEYTHKMQVTEDLAKLVLHYEEFNFWKALPSNQKRTFFYWYWSQKEAILKAVGVGLGYPLSSIHIEFLDHHPHLISFDQFDQNINKFFLSLIKTPSDYIGFIALIGGLEFIKYKKF